MTWTIRKLNQPRSKIVSSNVLITPTIWVAQVMSIVFLCPSFSIMGPTSRVPKNLPIRARLGSRQQRSQWLVNFRSYLFISDASAGGKA